MFTLKSRSQMAKAIETAKARYPKVKVLTLGRYLVRGSAGNYHTVSMHRDGQYKAIDCGCVAGQFGTPCYRSAAALYVHMGLVRMRTAVAAVAAVLAPRQKKAERVGAFTV